MFRSFKLALLAASVSSLAAPALAQTTSIVPGFSIEDNRARIESQVNPLITTVRQGDLYNSTSIVPGNRYTGVGGLFIQAVGSTGSGSLCTGALITSSIVVTAAHCLAGTDIGSIGFYTPDYVGGTGRTVYGASGFAIHPGYDDSIGVLGGNDIAVIQLSRVATGLEVYDIATTQDELNVVHTKVGTGTVGVGAIGTFPAPFDFDGEKRSGSNIYEYTWDLFTGSDDGITDAFGAPVGSILTFDFDSGTAQEDLFGRLGLTPQRGVVVGGQVRDVNSSPGDSGGPTFINGKIAGITSFGITGNAFEPLSVNCGDPTSVDQSFALETGACTNSSFGELSGDTRVSFFAGWLDSYRTGAGTFQAIGAVPEPSTWAMMIAGFGMVGFGMRRREKRVLA
jgi:hypothetical protein